MHTLPIGRVCWAPQSYPPVDVLWVRGIADGPVGDVEGLTAGGGTGLPTACTALALTSIEIFEDSEEKERDADTGWPGQAERDVLMLAFL